MLVPLEIIGKDWNIYIPSSRMEHSKPYPYTAAVRILTVDSFIWTVGLEMIVRSDFKNYRLYVQSKP